MNKKNILIVIIIILLVAGAILMLLNKKDIDIEPKEISVPGVSQEEKEDDILEESQEQNEKKVADSLIVLQKRLENKARFFIERYNTYSSDNNQENLRSLLPQVSSKLAKKINDFLTEKVDQLDYFYAYQTKVLSLNLSDFIDNEKAIFKGQIQEQKTEGEVIKVNYRTVTLEFVYQNGEWKVDNIELGT